MAIQVDESQLGKQIGARLRDHRLARGMTQAALGQRVGVKSSAVSSWEAGDSFPPLARAFAVCLVLGVGLALILGSKEGA